MKLKRIHIDGFGVWRDLDLDEFQGPVTAFFGPNEAGKTTVLQFVRAMLYGARCESRRYLPPLAGGSPGGHLVIEGPEEDLEVCRRFDVDSPAADRLRITNDRRDPRGAQDLTALLGGIDEATFNNVFAVGLRELQELGTLSDTEAANWLYSLSTGFDRVSLLEVMQHLERSREELLARDGSGGVVSSLVARRNEIAAQIDQATAQLGQWSQLQLRLEHLAAEIRSLHEAHSELTHESRTLEIAVQIAPRWQERKDLDRQLNAYAGRIRLPDDAIKKLDDLRGRIAGHQREADVLKRQQQALREEADRVGVNEVLVRRRSRVEALGEQKDWLDALQRQSVAIRAELSEIHSQLASENERLGVDAKPSANRQLTEITEALLSGLRPHARAIRVTKARLAAAEREAAARGEACEEYEAQLRIAMPAASEGMPTDLEEAGELVSALRRRLAVQERLQQARRNEAELEQQNHELLDRQELPLWIEASHTVLIVVGVALFAIGLFAKLTAVAWIGGVMLGVLLALRIFKYVGEEQVTSRREAIDRQIDVTRKQLREAQREWDALEEELGPLEGSIVVKLQAAERHLAELEKLLPIDGKLRDARREADSAARRAEEARRKVEAAVAAWRGKLAAAGLPKNWTPADLRSMAGRYEQIAELNLRAQRRREDAEQRQREHATLCERIGNLAEEVGLAEEGADPAVLLERLVSELRSQQTKLVERRRLVKRARQLQLVQKRHARAAAALIQRRDAMFHQAGAEDEAAFRRLVQEQQDADDLQRRREAISREIAAAIGSPSHEGAFAKLLESESVAGLETRWEETASRLEENEQRMHGLVEERGAVGQQLQTLAEDRTLAERQLELAAVETRLDQAVRQWQVRAATCTVVERIRAYYEKHRQPETLIEASRLFDRFTGGRYVRVWTPLGKNLLFVDTRDGASLAVEVLSRGTREQLFLALRIALVSLLARRGVSLPLVLDDVLVNFDARRAARAAEALVQFAEGGHQVLIFTCHEHIARLLRTLSVDVRRLPDRFADEGDVPAPRRRRKRRARPVVLQVEERKPAAEGAAAEEEELEVEPPSRPPVQYTYAAETDPEDHDEGEDTTLDVEDELEMQPLSPNVTPMVAHVDRLDEVEAWADWIRVGPQVRRREVAEDDAAELFESDQVDECDEVEPDDDMAADVSEAEEADDYELEVDEEEPGRESDEGDREAA